MSEFKIEIDGKKIKDTFNEAIDDVIKKCVEKDAKNIEDTIKLFFDKGFFRDKISSFDMALDWNIELAFREGCQKAMDELNFKELISEKVKEILSDNDFIKDLADAKVRNSLGLPSRNKATE